MFREFLDNIKSSLEVASINGGALLISMSDVEQWLRIASLVLALVYTGVKLRNLLLNSKKTKG